MVQSHLPPFPNVGNFVTHICLCLSEETLKAGGPFKLVSMPGEVKDPIQEVNSGLTNSSTTLKNNDNNGQQVDRGYLMEEEGNFFFNRSQAIDI